MDDKEKLFDDLFHDYYQTIFRYCVTIVVDEHMADEITQEAYVRLWQVWEERVVYPPKLNKGWLIRAVEYIIKEKGRQVENDNIDELAELIGNENEMVLKNESLQYEFYLKKMKMYLKPRDQELFELYVIKEWTYSEIANYLGMRESSVRSRVTRMRKRLKPYVEKMFGKKIKKLKKCSKKKFN